MVPQGAESGHSLRLVPMSYAFPILLSLLRSAWKCSNGQLTSVGRGLDFAPPGKAARLLGLIPNLEQS